MTSVTATRLQGERDESTRSRSRRHERSHWQGRAVSRSQPMPTAGRIGPNERVDATPRRVVQFLALCCVGLIPWTIALAVTLPRHYLVADWPLAWTGFDFILFGCLSTTAWALWKQREVAVSASMITSVLLGCDAWFDILTAMGGSLSDREHRHGHARRTAPRGAVGPNLHPAAASQCPGGRRAGAQRGVAVGMAYPSDQLAVGRPARAQHERHSIARSRLRLRPR